MFLIQINIVKHFPNLFFHEKSAYFSHLFEVFPFLKKSMYSSIRTELWKNWTKLKLMKLWWVELLTLNVEYLEYCVSVTTEDKRFKSETDVSKLI